LEIHLSRYCLDKTKRTTIKKIQNFSSMEEWKLDSEGGKRRGSRTIKEEEHWEE